LIVDLVKAEGPQQGLYGAKVTGGGAGGTVAILGIQSKQAEEAFARVVARFARETGYTPYVFEGSSPGADRFGILEIHLP
jgi:L-arabinokinase